MTEMKRRGRPPKVATNEIEIDLGIAEGFARPPYTVFVLGMGSIIKGVFSTPESLKAYIEKFPPKKQVTLLDFYGVRTFAVDDPEAEPESVALRWFMRDDNNSSNA